MKWVEMLGECHEMLAHQRATPRWKEWIPLATQQLRLRNLIQVIAYNVSISEKLKNEYKTKDSRVGKIKTSFYYTLHLTTMSAPFYTSEKVENENPKWAEIEIGDFVNSVNASVSGIVVRLWVNRSGAGVPGPGLSTDGAAVAAATSADQVLTVWGVSFSGLGYLGPRPTADPRAFDANTLVFHMRGGYFTAPLQCERVLAVAAASAARLLPMPPVPRERRISVRLPSTDIKPSYSVALVSRLHTIQQAIKKQRAAAAALRERISAGASSAAGGGVATESAALRRLLARGRPPAHALRQRALAARRRAEDARCRVSMLRGERMRAARRLQTLLTDRQRLLDSNQDRGLELMNHYQELHKDIERLKERKKKFMETRDSYITTNAQLIYRQKQLISKLSQIYPIQKSIDEYSICGVHLPNSEDFAGKDDIMISVSLGYVAHVLQMISFFLEVPLRYPIIHFGSWSKIVDHIVEKIPEKDREFPLFSRGKDKLQFSYGVYLLNKNVSQLRCYCGLPTHDLRTTLPNLFGLLHIQSMSVTDGSSRAASPASRRTPAPPPGEASPPPLGPPLPPPASLPGAGPRVARAVTNAGVADDGGGTGAGGACEVTAAGLRAGASLSLSLDKGLDEFQLAQRLERLQLAEPNIAGVPVNLVNGPAGSVRGGSEPSLFMSGKDSSTSSRPWAEETDDEARKSFLRCWQASGPAPVRADDELLTEQVAVVQSSTLVDQDPEIQTGNVLDQVSMSPVGLPMGQVGELLVEAPVDQVVEGQMTIVQTVKPVNLVTMMQSSVPSYIVPRVLADTQIDQVNFIRADTEDLEPIVLTEKNGLEHYELQAGGYDIGKEGIQAGRNSLHMADSNKIEVIQRDEKDVTIQMVPQEMNGENTLGEQFSTKGKESEFVPENGELDPTNPFYEPASKYHGEVLRVGNENDNVIERVTGNGTLTGSQSVAPASLQEENATLSQGRESEVEFCDNSTEEKYPTDEGIESKARSFNTSNSLRELNLGDLAKVQDNVLTEVTPQAMKNTLVDAGVFKAKIKTSTRRRALSEAAEECLSAEESERLSMLEEALSLDAVSGLLERTVFVDSAFASVASRTEALASRTGSFNLVRSRHPSALDD